MKTDIWIAAIAIGVVTLLVNIVWTFLKNRSGVDKTLKEILDKIGLDIKEIHTEIDTIFKTIIEDYTKKKDFDKLGGKFDDMRERVIKMEKEVEIFGVQLKEYIKNENTNSRRQ